jgi:hypothetical protein
MGNGENASTRSAGEDAVPAGKDVGFWDKLDVLIKPIGGLIAAAVVAFVSCEAKDQLEKHQSAEANRRLYTDLLTKRETAECQVRKDMFLHFIKDLLETDKEGEAGGGMDVEKLEQRILILELLAGNFHESIGLKPLFLHLLSQVEELPAGDLRKDLVARLERLARDVGRKQSRVVAEGGATLAWSVDLEDLEKEDGKGVWKQVELRSDEAAWDATVLLTWPDTDRRELDVQLCASPGGEPATGDPPARFLLSFFDFPMVDSLRLPGDQRLALVLTDWLEEGDEPSVSLLAILYPGRLASLRDRRYIDDLIRDLPNGALAAR